MTNQTDVVEAIRKEAKSNKVADAVFHMWAERERARNSVTIAGLEQRMKAKGFEFDKQEYAKFLRFIANLGIGRLDTDLSGRVKALNDVKITLQSVGKTALGAEAKIEQWRPRNRFEHIKPKDRHDAKPHTEQVKIVSINIAVRNKPVTVTTDSLDPQEIAALVNRLQNS